MKQSTSTRYHRAFLNYIDGKDVSSDEFAERQGFNGGVFLPSETEKLLDTEMTKHNIFRQISPLLKIEKLQFEINAMTPVGKAVFVPDNEAIPEFMLEQKRLKINSYKIAQCIKLSCEFAKDTQFDLLTALIREFGRGFGVAQESGCLISDGVDSPYGLLHDEQGAEVGATAETLGFDDIVALYFSLKAEYRRNAVWIMNDETAYKLRSLKSDDGLYLWNHNTDTLFGKPVFVSEFMPSAETGAKPLLFGDFSFFWLIERGGATLQILKELYALGDQRGYIGTLHIDSRLVRREAVKALVMA
jgi:HK97 family phage major capsid protein